MNNKKEIKRLVKDMLIESHKKALQNIDKIEALKEGQKLPIHSVSNLLCGSFDPDNNTSSATKCKCGREKWEHPKAT